MTYNEILNSTPRQVAKTYSDHNRLYSLIGNETGLDIDSIANTIGDNNVYDMTGTEIADNLDNAFYDWYDNNDIPRPDYTPTNLAVDIVIYSAWQLLTEV